jgi:hypothetical protein
MTKIFQLSGIKRLDFDNFINILFLRTFSKFCIGKQSNNENIIMNISP